MNKKLRRVSCSISIVIFAILLLCSLAGLALVLCKNLLSFSNMQKFFYLSVGEIILPIELLLKGKVGAFGEKMFATFAISALIVILILCLFLLRDLIKVKKTYQKNKFFIVSLLITLFIIVGYFVFSIVSINSNAPAITKYLSAIVDQKFIVNTIQIKANILPAVYIAVAIFTIVAVIVTREKETKLLSSKQTGDGMCFYSSDYEESEKEVKETKVQASEMAEVGAMVDVTEKGKSQALLQKIMELNEMKDSGQISSVEYTRLRQKAIRRYKKWENYL